MSCEVIIGGFGAAGASLALALVAGGVDAAAITVFDSRAEAGTPEAGHPDARFIALNAGSRRFLAALGAWERLSDRAWPMRAMALSDTGLEEAFRPRLLDMAAGEGDAPLAHLVPLARLTATLRDLCREAGVAVLSASLAGFRADSARITVDLADRVLEGRLLIAADGAASPIRLKAGIPSHGWAYGQTALVSTLRHSLAHHGEAVQHFLPSGPFALLPLDDYRSSLVWSEKAGVAADLLASDPQTQKRAIAARAAGWRGDILGVEALSAHPLQLRLSRRFIGDRLALVADAAHVVHPLAGQGLNLGLEDAAMLAELIVERLRLGLDPGAPDLLEAYQARRRPAAVAMAFATEGINRLFSNDSAPLRMVRDFGAGVFNRLPGVKTRLMAAAAGGSPLSPRLFRGEAL
jgi:2-octaprenyl-6-methoxyphenol hydroxylase